MSRRPLIFIIPIPNPLSSLLLRGRRADCVGDGRTGSSAPTKGLPHIVLSLSFRASPQTGVGIRSPRPQARSCLPTPLPMHRVSVPCLSLWERWPSAARTERANKKEPPSGRFFSLSINPLYAASSSFTQGELEGGKARLESDQMSRKALPCKACVEHPKGTCFAARSDYFCAARRQKNNDIIFRLSKKPEVFSTAKKHPSGAFLLCFILNNASPAPPAAA